MCCPIVQCENQGSSDIFTYRVYILQDDGSVLRYCYTPKCHIAIRQRIGISQALNEIEALKDDPNYGVRVQECES
jgi:hypothetical protein